MENRLEKILKDWETECKIDETNLDNETIKCSKLHSKYLNFLTEYKLKLKKYLSDKDQLEKDLWLYYHGKMTKEQIDDRGWPYDPFEGMKITLKSDYNKFIETDPLMVKINNKIDYFKIVIETLEEIINTIRWRHSNVKNIIEWRKFTAGD